MFWRILFCRNGLQLWFLNILWWWISFRFPFDRRSINVCWLLFIFSWNTIILWLIDRCFYLWSLVRNCDWSFWSIRWFLKLFWLLFYWRFGGIRLQVLVFYRLHNASLRLRYINHFLNGLLLYLFRWWYNWLLVSIFNRRLVKILIFVSLHFHFR